MTTSSDFAALGITTIGAVATIESARIIAETLRRNERRARKRRATKIRRLV